MNSDAVDARPHGPSVRPLGYIAVGCGVLGILLAPTFFFSLLALPPGVLAVALGRAARSEESTRELGTAAVILGLGAVLLAAGVLVYGFTLG